MTTTEHTHTEIRSILSAIPLFSALPEEKSLLLAQVCSVERYTIGKPVIGRDTLPEFLYIISSGRVRSLYQDSANASVQTLRLLGSGDIFGWVSLMRRKPTEIVTVSEDAVCLKIPSSALSAVVNAVPALYGKLSRATDPAEICALLDRIYTNDPKKEIRLNTAGFSGLKDFALQLYGSADVVDTGFGRSIPKNDLKWFVSRSENPEYQEGTRFPHDITQIPASLSLRLVGLDFSDNLDPDIRSEEEGGSEEVFEMPEMMKMANSGTTAGGGKAETFNYNPEPEAKSTSSKGFPFIRSKGDAVEESMACFLMLGKYWNIPVKKDLIRSVLGNQFSRNGQLSLQDCGGVGVLLGLKVQVVTFQEQALSRLKVPAIIRWENSFAVLYKVSAKEVLVAVPSSQGVKTIPAQEFWEKWSHKGEALVLDVKPDTPESRFGFDWFLPSINKYRNVLAEVLIASFFTQIMTLVNPLLFMIIIDQVIVRNSFTTLHVLGLFMLVIAVLESVLSSLKTWLFVDTSNRIDVSLGAEVIDHLLRLPLRFFERRPVGELSSRIGELERIRQFLTGTALSVVLDAVFSVVYVIVLFAFSWKLALLSLSVIPLIGLVTFFVSPVIRKQLREKSIRHGETNAYLIEVLSGIQTVKSQNIELRARWNWQEKYAGYVREGFKPVVTGTLANSTNSFLSKLSGLIVIWAGAWLVLNNELTLGQLIAFRIIAGYITSPVMRLAQLWQNFQETGMSLERLADIVDTPQEGGKDQLSQIPLPLIKGEIRTENVSFRFRENNPLVLKNINLTIPAGSFVGIVGESGSGKSTFAKLIQRLYSLDEGRIFIDSYDIGKVELNSLRSQIGIVPQDPMLFNISVKENIALTNPEASDADIIRAAKIAEAHDFIMAMPSGYSTPVGEKGSSLSGGQRQRIAIARTILQNPGMIILDEATSALDPQTESKLTDNMIQAFRDKTVLFITHRINSVKGASMILCFHDGHIDESGIHNDLMERKGRYYSLFQKQTASIPSLEGKP
ncbi:MAG: ATP-binding cassette domain-containing protein [Chlorobium limicola]|uniref:Cyclic nucleotide-regulated ABC bacteriocin/lantibiotic exporter n=1 Tax=Chlorobium limicola (strain DSM 245 / NBRC 103803 / 6330) TaxID=290315 RepID=B3EE00_CHLL2|nr:peptidase domain-containing ABC transporter [Chlorobium limicola]ACD90702.1 cyclic nucleotide-regulated ABC bacteriocin/lantibiotic exporter [Chlorobium limicola DSM 245]NTV21649.1 ATP-binding cassette domain-containing protein [Chlorobium limicola]